MAAVRSIDVGDSFESGPAIWNDDSELTEENIEAAERELEEYTKIEQSKSLWAPEDTRLNRWILRTDETVDLDRLRRSLNLPPSIPMVEVNCSHWKSFKDVAETIDSVFPSQKDLWRRDDLPDTTAMELFWDPPFVVFTGVSKIGVVAFSPFMTLYWGARFMYEQSLDDDEEPTRFSALIIQEYPYTTQAYDFGEDDRGIALIPTVELR